MMITRRSTLTGISSLAASAFLPSCSRANAPIEHPVSIKDGFAKLRNSAAQFVETGSVAGLAIGMSGLGFRKSAYFGFADASTRRKVSANTQFRIASATKPVVAASALQLEEEQQLSLSFLVSDYFPDFPKGDQISLTQLLQHTSGLANWWGRLPEHTSDDFMNGEDAVSTIANMPNLFLFEPGTMRSYSNTGYVLLGKILEKNQGRNLDSILQTTVLQRVGADNTQLENSVQSKENWAKGYETSLLGFEEAAYVPPPQAAGGLRSTLHDQLAFGDALFLGPLLEPATKLKMFRHARVSDGRLVQDAMYDSPEAPAERPQSDTTELGYGLGINTWVQLGERFYSHGGLINGFTSYLLHAPRTGVTISILSNTFQGPGDLNEQARSLLRNLPGSSELVR